MWIFVPLFYFFSCKNSVAQDSPKTANANPQVNASAFEEILPDQGILVLHLQGELKEFASASPAFRDSVRVRLQKLLPQGILLKMAGSVCKGETILGKLEAEGQGQKRQFPEPTDARKKYKFVRKTLMIKAHEVYSLRFKVRMQPAKYQIYKIKRTTNWDDFYTGEIVPLDGEGTRKSHDRDYYMRKFLSSSLWGRIPHFKFLGFHSQQYLFFEP